MSKEKNVLSIVARDATGKGPAGRLRREGKIPAIVYSKGKQGEMVTLDSGEWRSLMQEDVKLVHLQENGKEKCAALIKDVQENFLKGTVTHVDLQEVSMTEKVLSKCAIHPSGSAAGESQGGRLEQVIYEIDIEATPTNLPESIEVDVSGIGLEEKLLARDVVLPDGVVYAGDDNLIAFHVVKSAAEASAEGEDAETE